MRNDPSVMKGLHRISGQIAEASRQNASRSTGVPQSGNQWQDLSTDMATVPTHTVPRTVTPPPRSPAVPVPTAAPAVPGPSPVSEVLEASLLRRYEDYLRSRRDLAGRLTETAASIRCDLTSASARVRFGESALASLQELQDRLAGDADSFDPRDQLRMSAEYRALERTRLETLRLIAECERTGGGGPVSGAASPVSASRTDLLSLTFGQMMKMGFAFFFPVILAMLLAALLIGAAVVCAFNGVFAW